MRTPIALTSSCRSKLTTKRINSLPTQFHLIQLGIRLLTYRWLRRRRPSCKIGAKWSNSSAFARNEFSRRRNKVIVGLLVNQGLRAEEIKALCVQDIWLREGQITVHSQRRTAQRILALEPGQVYELMDYLLEVRKAFLSTHGPSDRLFLQRHQSENVYSVTARLLKYLRQINGSVKNLDQLRASVITHWVKIYDLRKAQYMAGHRYVSST